MTNKPSFNRAAKPSADNGKRSLVSGVKPQIFPTSVRLYEDEKRYLDALTEDLQKEFGKRISTTVIVRALLHKYKNNNAEWYAKIIKDLPII